MCVPLVIDTPPAELTEAEKAALLAQQKGTTGDGTAPAGGTAGTTNKPAGGRPGGENQGNASQKTPLELLQANNEIALSDLQGQNNQLVDSIANQAAGFQQTADAILEAQKKATDALGQGFLSLTDLQKKAMDEADALRKNTGQASRKPNYSVSLKANAKSNRSGISSTMLTGAGGVATGSLPLGKASLLGGA